MYEEMETINMDSFLKHLVTKLNEKDTGLWDRQQVNIILTFFEWNAVIEIYTHSNRFIFSISLNVVMFSLAPVKILKFWN